MADRYERDRYGRERGYGRDDRDDRGMLERAGDEVRSWFGDEEAARRRERDERESYRRGEYGRGYGREHGGPRYGESEERAWAGSSGERWRESERHQDDWRPRQDWNMAASRPAHLEAGARYGGSASGSDYDRFGRNFRDEEERSSYGASSGSTYSGGAYRSAYDRPLERSEYREREFQGGRGEARNRDYPSWNYQDTSSAASDYGYIGSSGGWTQGRGQYTGRGPKGYQRSDERIREDVCDRLADDPHIDASDIEISVQNAEVTLSGFVRSRYDKRHAEDVVETISGVRDVNNALRINRGQNPGDVIGLNTEKGSGPITKK
jgi:osmotically-inducible protein OsmY